MRVLICNWRDLAHPQAGGAEVYAHEIARCWVAAGHDVTQFSAAVADRPAREERDGVRIVRAGGRHSVYTMARRWYQTQRRDRFDLVLDAVNTRPFGCASWPGAAPVAALVHQVCREIWFSELPWPVAAAGRWGLEPWWLRRLRDVPVFTVSASSAQSLRDYGLARVQVVGIGGPDPARAPVAREQTPTVVFVGRLAANKQPEQALAAFVRLRQRRPDAQLWVIGDGPQRDRLQARRTDGVRFFGRVSRQVRDELLARAHVAVVTSVREGWGMVVDEAAAAGTPSVGYDRPGLRDSIPAAGGVLVDPRPEALAAALDERLDTWVSTPAPAGWRGGARPWAEVAADLLAGALQQTPAVGQDAQVGRR